MKACLKYTCQCLPGTHLGAIQTLTIHVRNLPKCDKACAFQTTQEKDISFHTVYIMAAI